MKSDLFSRYQLCFYVVIILGSLNVREMATGFSLSSYEFTNLTKDQRQTKICDGFDQYQCKSGQCISIDNKCDGIIDCDDKSDETKETCHDIYCPSFTFKCSYGACIDRDAECNGVKNCVDNSDEENCTSVVQTSSSRLKRATDGGGCELPEHPDFGQWTLVSGARSYPKQKVSVATAIRFGCNEGYKLSRDTEFVVCAGTKWSVSEMPTCLKKCPPIYSNKVTDIQCLNNRNVKVKCDEATDGTSATFTCATYYESSDRNPNSKTITKWCWSGSWDLPLPVCEPVCGEKRVTAKPLIVKGKKVVVGNYPWMAAIYKVTDGYLNICGGSILSQRVVLTAAHCVTDDMGNPLEKGSMEIGVGKYYKDYKDSKDTLAQYSKLDKIIVPNDYTGDYQRYASDIALLITRDILLLSAVVQPVCFQNLPNIYLESEIIGVITGWGFTESSGSPSNELRELPVPYKPDSVCKDELPRDWALKYYTRDKMCAGHYNKSVAVCSGDSGGGLVFRNPNDQRYYVHGIVSVSYVDKGSCDVQLSALYTKVASHYEWVHRLVSQYHRSTITTVKECLTVDCKNGTDEFNKIKDVDGPCVLPEHPDFGQWSIVGGAPNDPKKKVALNTILKFSCNEGYKLSSGNVYVVCMVAGWTVKEMPTCLKTCPPLYSTETTNIKCVNNQNLDIKCDEVTHESSATFTCAPYYELSNRNLNNQKDKRRCWSGSWDLPPPFCQPVCGEKIVSATPLIVNGQKSVRGDYPWVAAVYKGTGEFRNICGGSILTQRVILTAAHCVTDIEGKAVDKESIVVGVGKYFNKYKDPRDTQAQYSKIDKIIIPSSYKGEVQRYASNIALLVTKDAFLLSKVVQPVCFQDLPDIDLESGNTGVVTGWGFTEPSGTPSDELREITVPYKSEQACTQELPVTWAEKYFTYDKICAGLHNKSTSVCQGDSGGGLVFKNRKNQRYYVHGIVSAGHSENGNCNVQVSTLYTNVAAHYNWLEREVSQYLRV